MNPLRQSAEEELLEWMRQWPRPYLVSDVSDDDRFDVLALRLFAFQWAACAPYRRLCDSRGVSLDTVRTWRDIPAVPTQAFKVLAIRSFPKERESHVFRTSGTSEGPRGELHLDSTALYDASLLPTFRHFLLPRLESNARARIRVLAPSPEETPDSSLSHMFGVALEALGDTDSGYDVRRGALDVESFLEALEKVVAQNTPLLLAGTAFAFVHTLDALTSRARRFALPPGSTLMETGGFKGRSRVIPKNELYAKLREAFGVNDDQIINQYGMTELGSQFYDVVSPDSKGGRAKGGPPWVRVRIVDPTSGSEQPAGEIGVIEIVDLANTGSVIAVRTQDLGCRIGDGFEVLGRAGGADLRGCSVAADTMLAR